MIRKNLTHQIILWILIPIVAIIVVVHFQLNTLLHRYEERIHRDLGLYFTQVEREMTQLLDTTKQLGDMLSQDQRVLQAIKENNAGLLFQTGKQVIDSRLVDRVTIIDRDGIVLARGHEEFAFNDSLAKDRLYQFAAGGGSFSGLVAVEDGLSFLSVFPVREFDSIFQGVVVVSRRIAPEPLQSIAEELGLEIIIDNKMRENPGERNAPVEEMASISRKLPFQSLDRGPMIMTIRKSYAAEVKDFMAARTRISFFTLLATAVVVVFVFLSVRYLLRPMQRLQSWLRQYREGTLEIDDLNWNLAALPIPDSELGFIAQSALSTLQELEKARKELEVLHGNLEQQVCERTRELLEKTEQLRIEIQERSAVELRVEKLKDQLQSVFDSMSCMLIGFDSSGLVLFANREAMKHIDISCEGVIGRDITWVLKVLSIPDDFLKQMPADKDGGSFRRYKAESGGEIRYLDIVSYPFSYQRGGGTVVRIDDVTNNVLLEQELHNSEQLKAIGVLAGGIAHDFNNVMVAILGNITLALYDPALGKSTKDMLEKAEKACGRARELARQLLTFARGGKPVKRKADLAAIVKETAVRAASGYQVVCRFLFAEDLLPVEIDADQIAQTIRNVVCNAAQAAGKDSCIDITCRNVRREEDVHLAGMAVCPYICIQVTDQGCGMAGEVRSRAFDPYFSTKADQNGLGLTICHSIVKNHDGRIIIESEPGSGTVVSIYLPALKTEAVEATGKEEHFGLKGGECRVLVMDDDPMVREAAGAMLEALGHEVCFAEDGEEAVRMYREAQKDTGPFDVVLMDLTIPGGMGGKDAATRILEFDSEARLVVSSGYSNDPVVAHYREHGFSAAICKPYEMAGLAGIIADVSQKGA